MGWGYDTTGLGGGKTIGYSTNGKNFYALIGPDGLIVRKNDGNRIYGTIADQIDSAISANVIPAKSAADSAVAYANDAIEKSRVNSQAIDDINSAVSDAVSDAAVARSDGLRAWNAAQSNVNLIDLNYASASASISSARTEAIAAADEAKASASAAQADIAAVRSDVAAVQAEVTINKSDVAAAKSDISVVKTDLASQSTNLSSYAAQASAAGKDITTLKSQAGQLEQDMADTKGDVSQLKVSASAASVALSDAAGNISSLQATAKSYSAALSDTNSNVATVTATASELETKYADAAGDINKLQTDAKGTTQTLNDAQGDIAKLKIRADGFDTEFADTKGNISKLQTDATGTTQTLANTKSDVAVLQSRADGLDAKYADAAGDINTLKANASGFSQTLVSAKGDISTLQATATGLKNTLTDAQGNISTLQTDVSGLKKTTSDNKGNISSLQVKADSLTSQMSSAQGDISTLQQTASGISSKVSGMETSLADANGKINDITSNGGGRNLIANTGTDIVIDATSSNANNWMFVMLYFIEQPKQGDLITVSAEGTLTGTGALDEYQVVLFNRNTTSQRSRAQYLKAGKRNSVTLSLDNLNGDGDTLLLIYAGKASETKGKKNVVHHLMVEKGTVAHDWSPAPEDTDAKITTNTTAIEQNKKAITLKADQTTVDKTNGTVQQLQSQLKVQADQINSKVSSSDLDAKGYATQTYTQTQVKQTADTWNANLTSVKNGLTQSYTNLHATVDGIQAQVYNSDGSSKITQLSNLIATKVSQDDYNSQITQLKNDINLRVTKGDLISQINLQAGTALIQSNKLVLDNKTTVFTGDAFIPSAAISSIQADKIKLGSSSLYDSNGTLNLVNVSDGTKSKITATHGDVYVDGILQNSSIIQFSSDSNLNAFTVTPAGATVTPTLFFERYDQAPGHWLGFTRNQIRYEGVEFHTWDDDGERFGVDCHARFNKNIRVLGTFSQGSWDGTPQKPDAGVLYIKNGNTIWSGSNFLAIGDNLSGSYTNVMARSFSQQSTLSSKTNIETVDPKDALDLVNRTDIRSYQYKTDVAEGKTKRYTSLIIDDVNDVSEYYAPDEFTNEERTGRDDGSAVGYLFLAVQELTRRIKTLEDKLNG
ncbi:hypothetical protein DPF85_05830 [Limosilactobacillus fermentum]|nr:hypothetical protein DPF85_05830 [Limosilactobacillus fermentum]